MTEERSGGGGGGRDDGVGGGGGGEPSSSRTTPSYVKSGDRQLFTVELQPGETTFVSWKKLMKDANKNSSGSKPISDEPPPPPPANAHPNLESRIAPGGQQADNEEKDDAPHRFSAVIEKIERLYMGNDSSDDEDLKDAPDDDQYDTEDSFIDDAELDEYFEVDNSAIKHDGFFVNRGKLERISEPVAIPEKQPKKRRRKDLTKAHGDSDNINVSNKHVKIGKSAAGKMVQSVGKNTSGPSQNLTMEIDYQENGKCHNPLNLSGTSTKKKCAGATIGFDPSSTTKMSNGDASASLVEGKDFQMQEPGFLQGNNFSNKSKDATGSSDAYYLKHQTHDKSAYGQNKLQSAKPLNNVEEPEPSARSKERNGVRMLPDLNNVPDGKISVDATASHVHKRDGSSVRPKVSILEKTIRELERMVAESRPPVIDNQEADASSQAIKRRLPSEIKMKLAKVARLAANQGKMSKDLINRLMSSLGHLIQLRTLKRNLRIMVKSGLSAQQEKDNRYQMIKKEVAEMIRTRVPTLESKALEQHAGTSDDFQELNPENKPVKRKFSMDAELEDKICDLYDLFVDGLDEDAGPHVRKLYVELAGLWPSGTMDNHGIKRAICRAKDRRRAVYSRNKVSNMIISSKPEEAVQADPTSASQPQMQHSRERLASDLPAGPVLALASIPISSPTALAQGSSLLLANAHSIERPKQDKAKGCVDMAKPDADAVLVKKKAKKRKPVAAELDQPHFRSEKLYSSSEERHKSAIPQKLQHHQPGGVASPHGFEQSS
ncbi:UBN1 [Linum perenne]